MERPILFSGAMVRAILEGRKTQTRRVVKIYGLDDPDCYETRDGDLVDPVEHCPYGRKGDRLWVRETFAKRGKDRSAIYKADSEAAVGAYGCVRWKPSIYMPRWASRINLEITYVRIERLQDISEDDAQAEGTTPYTAPAEMPAYKPAFADLWDRINGERGYGWDVNPWVWAISFKVVK